MIRTFQIACVNKIPERERKDLYFDYIVQNEITFTLWALLVELATHPGVGGFIPGPNWFVRPASLEPYDVVVYFVPDPARSVAIEAGAVGATGRNAGGWTVSTPKGVVCEVYVGGNLPARRLAKIALHEIMHNKLDVGGRVLSDLHAQGGGALARPPTEEWTGMSAKNKTLLGRHLFHAVRQYTGGM